MGRVGCTHPCVLGETSPRLVEANAACQAIPHARLDNAPTLPKITVLSYSDEGFAQVLRSQCRGIGYTIWYDVGCIAIANER